MSTNKDMTTEEMIIEARELVLSYGKPDRDCKFNEFRYTYLQLTEANLTLFKTMEKLNSEEDKENYSYRHKWMHLLPCL